MCVYRNSLVEKHNVGIIIYILSQLPRKSLFLISFFFFFIQIIGLLKSSWGKTGQKNVFIKIKQQPRQFVPVNYREVTSLSPSFAVSHTLARSSFSTLYIGRNLLLLLAPLVPLISFISHLFRMSLRISQLSALIRCYLLEGLAASSSI